jgi:hypothetical protein
MVKISLAVMADVFDKNMFFAGSGSAGQSEKGGWSSLKAAMVCLNG